jgi:hypothetical protein
MFNAVEALLCCDVVEDGGNLHAQFLGPPAFVEPHGIAAAGADWFASLCLSNCGTGAGGFDAFQTIHGEQVDVRIVGFVGVYRSQANRL